MLEKMHKSARGCHLHGLFPPSLRSFSATLSGLLATQTIFTNNERGTSKNAVTTFKEVHRNDGLQENSYASKYGGAANAKWNAIRLHPAKPARQYLKPRIGSGFAGLSMMTLPMLIWNGYSFQTSTRMLVCMLSLTTSTFTGNWLNLV